MVPSAEEVLPAARALALELVAGSRPRVRALSKSDKLPNMMVLNFMLTTAREGTEKARARERAAQAAADAPRRLQRT